MNKVKPSTIYDLTVHYGRYRGWGDERELASYTDKGKVLMEGIRARTAVLARSYARDHCLVPVGSTFIKASAKKIEDDVYFSRIGAKRLI